MKRGKSLVMILLGLLLVVAGCRQETQDEAGAESTNEQSEGEGKTEEAAPGDESEPQKENTGFDALAALEKAGFEADPSVPFDDGGAIPIDFSSGDADKQIAADVWVLKRDDAWVQVASGTFEDAASARAFADGHEGAVARENTVFFVLPLGDQSPVSEVESALAP